MERRDGDALDRRLRAAHSIEDLRLLAARRTPKPVFDYVDGAAEDELAIARARDSFSTLEFHPHVLRDVVDVDTSTTMLGRRSRLPLLLAPTGFTRMVNAAGERAVVRAARDAGVPYALSTMGTTTVEEIVNAAPDADVWFQLYVWRDRERSKELIDRARAAGVKTLMLTVDVPVAGARLRDVRGGLTIPPSIRPRTLAQLLRFPGWWLNLLTAEPLTFANFSGAPDTLAEIVATMFDAGVTLDDVDWLRAQWDGAIVVKGVQRSDDAHDLVRCGVDGLVVSNHGGRQLDRTVVPLELLPDVVERVAGRAEVFVDGGIRSGADVAAAVALGARGCLIGRAYLYGLMAGGGRGVDRALELLMEQFARTMRLLGVNSVANLTPDLVTLRTGR